jgi:hypothetical protein
MEYTQLADTQEAAEVQEILVLLVLEEQLVQLVQRAHHLVLEF